MFIPFVLMNSSLIFTYVLESKMHSDSNNSKLSYL